MVTRVKCHYCSGLATIQYEGWVIRGWRATHQTWSRYQCPASASFIRRHLIGFPKILKKPTWIGNTFPVSILWNWMVMKSNSNQIVWFDTGIYKEFKMIWILIPVLCRYSSIAHFTHIEWLCVFLTSCWDDAGVCSRTATQKLSRVSPSLPLLHTRSSSAEGQQGVRRKWIKEASYKQHNWCRYMDNFQVILIRNT